MNNHQIHIDRININGQGIAPSIAQAATQGLGQELLTGLTQQSWSPGRTVIGDLQLGTVQVNNPQDVQEIRQAISQAVIQAIVTKTGIRS
jgi:hypothetical protein